MFSLKPIPENQASGEIAEIYRSVKQTYGVVMVPLIFQYLAVFPNYLSYIWQQAAKNLHDLQFKNQTLEIEEFAQKSISSIYTPSTLTKLFLEKIYNRAEKLELTKFVVNISQMNASLYLLSLAIRESLKGRFLGIKQIGKHISENEKSAFNDLSEGFAAPSLTPIEKKADLRIHTDQKLTHRPTTEITTSIFAQFFDVIEKEMKRLFKEENYLTRRVELERFALSRLHLIPHPLDSSISKIFTQAYDHPQFPELIYLIADLFPTQTPFKLMASAVMKKSLDYSLFNANTRSTEVSVV